MKAIAMILLLGLQPQTVPDFTALIPQVITDVIAAKVPAGQTSQQLVIDIGTVVSSVNKVATVPITADDVRGAIEQPHFFEVEEQSFITCPAPRDTPNWTESCRVHANGIAVAFRQVMKVDDNTYEVWVQHTQNRPSGGTWGGVTRFRYDWDGQDWSLVFIKELATP